MPWRALASAIHVWNFHDLGQSNQYLGDDALSGKAPLQNEQQNPWCHADVEPKAATAVDLNKETFFLIVSLFFPLFYLKVI